MHSMYVCEVHICVYTYILYVDVCMHDSTCVRVLMYCMHCMYARTCIVHVKSCKLVPYMYKFLRFFHKSQLIGEIRKNKVLRKFVRIQ